MKKHQPKTEVSSNCGALEDECAAAREAGGASVPDGDRLSKRPQSPFGDKVDNMHNGFNFTEKPKKKNEPKPPTKDPFSDKVDNFKNNFTPAKTKLPSTTNPSTKQRRSHH